MNIGTGSSHSETFAPASRRLPRSVGLNAPSLSITWPDGARLASKLHVQCRSRRQAMLENATTERLCSLKELEDTTRSLLSGGHRAKILILECDADVRSLWQTVLERDGHWVTAPESDYERRSAVSPRLGRPYDLVILEPRSLPEFRGCGRLSRLCTPNGHLLITEGTPDDLDYGHPEKVRLWPKPFPIDSLRWLASKAANNCWADPMVAIVCDDCPHTRSLLASVAHAAGFEPVCTADGSQVPALAAAFEASVVFLDILMPGQDGLATLSQLRKARLPVKVVAMSGGPELYLEAARQLGACQTLPKPFQVKTVLRFLSEISPDPRGWMTSRVDVVEAV